MIPKVIHYCWFGGKPLPKDVEKWIKSWKRCCPDYEIRQWNESNFDVSAHPFTKAAYEAKAWAFVSDYARLKILYENGGIYLDTDVELLKPLDDLLDTPCFVAVDQVDGVVATGLGFGAEAKSTAVKAMLDIYDNVEYDENNRKAFACPLLNTKALERFVTVSKSQICRTPELTAYPPRYFDPYAPGKSENLMCEDTYSIHHYSASWMPLTARLRRKIVELIGQERVAKLKGILKK